MASWKTLGFLLVVRYVARYQGVVDDFKCSFFFFFFFFVLSE